jgi:Fe-S cluster assembly protein SufD
VSAAHPHLADQASYASRTEAPPWLEQRRRSAASRFAALGLPGAHLESWRYTSAERIAKTRFRLASPPQGALDREAIARAASPVFACTAAVFVNGRFEAGFSSPEAFHPGVELLPLSHACWTRAELVKRYLAPEPETADEALAALNTAYLGEGAFVRILGGQTIESPIHVVNVSVPERGETVTHPRTLVIAEAGSRATVIEDYVALEDGAYFTNAVSEVYVEEGAGLDHVRLQREGASALHVGLLRTRQARNSRLASYAFSLGASFARNDVRSLLDGEGAECALFGLFAARERQHVDTYTVIDHAHPHGTSRELYKGILGGVSRGVFNGRIVVRPGAQRTDAWQASRNLLLSRGAEVDAKPQLEIHADDVRCSHGSTIGHLDEDALFYLRARGIPERRARGLLTRAFAAEIHDRVPVASLREPLAHWLEARMGEALEELSR